MRGVLPGGLRTVANKGGKGADKAAVNEGNKGGEKVGVIIGNWERGKFVFWWKPNQAANN